MENKKSILVIVGIGIVVLLSIMALSAMRNIWPTLRTRATRVDATPSLDGMEQLLIPTNAGDSNEHEETSTFEFSSIDAPPPGLAYIVQDSRGTWALWHTSEDENVVRLSKLAGPTYELDVSPTGKKLLFTAEDDIWLYDGTTGQVTNVTQTEDRSEGSPRWLPDGSGFVCGSLPTGRVSGPTPGHLTLVTLEGSYNVLDDTFFLAAPAAPSPDGSMIVYPHTPESASDLGFTLYRSGEGVESFNPDEFGVHSIEKAGEVSWSPSGKELSWASYRAGQAVIVLYNLETRAHSILETYLPGGIGGALPAPTWHPQGEALALNVVASEASERGLQIYVLDENREYTRQLFIPNTTPTPQPAFSLDGRTLAYPVGNHIFFVDLSTLAVRAWNAQGTVTAVGWSVSPP